MIKKFCMEFKGLPQQINAEHLTVIILLDLFLPSAQRIFIYNTDYEISNELTKWVERSPGSLVEEEGDRYSKSAPGLIGPSPLSSSFQPAATSTMFSPSPLSSSIQPAATSTMLQATPRKRKRWWDYLPPPNPCCYRRNYQVEA